MHALCSGVSESGSAWAFAYHSSYGTETPVNLRGRSIVSKIIIFKSAAGSISFRSTVSQSCTRSSIHACVGGPRPRAARASALRWRCRRLAAACPMRLVGDIRHATAVVHKVFGQVNKPGAPVTSSQGARDTNVRPPNRAWEGRSYPTKLAARAKFRKEPGS